MTPKMHKSWGAKTAFWVNRIHRKLNAQPLHGAKPTPRHHHSARRLLTRLDCTISALPRATAIATVR